MTVRVRVPATTANIGPGFDSFGAALTYYDEYAVAVSETPGVRVHVTGQGAGSVPTDARNLLAAALLHVYTRLELDPPTGLEITAVNRIPHGRGMGSSGSAIVGGIMLAKGLLRERLELSQQQVLEFATELEGHPDNVAPGIFGGFTVSWMDGDTPRVLRLEPNSELRPLVFVPDFELATKVARGLQPDQVPLQDAVFNVARAALLPAALTSHPELLLTATADRLHQGYRAPAMPASADLVAQLRAREIATVISGAGPSVLALVSAAAVAETRELATTLAPGWELHELEFDTAGARVEIVSEPV